MIARTHLSSAALLAQDFASITDLIHAHAHERPDAIAIADDHRQLNWKSFHALIENIASALQRDGAGQGSVVAVIGRNSIEYAAIFLGTIRIGGIAAPLMTSANAETLQSLVDDCAPTHLFADNNVLDCSITGARVIAMNERSSGTPMAEWLSGPLMAAGDIAIAPTDPFNIIYSSGTTSRPKGIVHSHAMRWSHIQRGRALGYGSDSITINSTPLYSNTTLVSFLPTIACGGRVILMAKFDATRFLRVAERERATHAALVPVQYSRLLALPDFDAFDLSSFRMKSCTSAPFPAALKAETLDRWPGELVEIYGLTEGGASCILRARNHPDKLHTVGVPSAGNELKLIDSDGRPVPVGETGEIVGRGPAMMDGYWGRPDDTAAASWFDEDGRRYIRHGDIGHIDADGFLVLTDRAKDVIISGGFNIFPSDLEAVLRAQNEIADAAVIGVDDAQWGETPVAFVVPAVPCDVEAVRQRTNEKLGRMQKISRIYEVESLPRSDIGKVLKRELKDRLVRDMADQAV